MAEERPQESGPGAASVARGPRPSAALGPAAAAIAAGVPARGGARTELVRLPVPVGGPVWVVRAEGPLDDDRHPALSATAGVPADCPTVAVDLSLLPALSPAAARALRRTAAELAARGRGVYVTGLSAASETALRVPGSDDGRLRIVPTLAHAVAELAGPAGGAGSGSGGPGSEDASRGAASLAARAAAPDGSGTGSAAAADITANVVGDAPEDELIRLRREVRHLTGRVRSHPLIDRAQGVVQGRYGLPAGDTAFALLRSVSQRHNVKLRLLASAVVLTTPPSGAGPWFPGRARRAAPPLVFLPGERPERASQTAVVNALLARAMEVTQAPMGDVRLVDPCSGELRIEAGRGHPDGFADDFAHLRQDEDGGATVAAVRRGVRVTVTDAVRDPALGDRARALLRTAGGRGSHATPLRGPGPRTHGVVTTLFDAPVQPLDARTARVLDRLAATAGTWLTWYYATIVRDALEDLHTRALAAAPQRLEPGPQAPPPY